MIVACSVVYYQSPSVDQRKCQWSRRGHARAPSLPSMRHGLTRWSFLLRLLENARESSSTERSSWRCVFCCWLSYHFLPDDFCSNVLFWKNWALAFIVCPFSGEKNVSTRFWWGLLRNYMYFEHKNFSKNPAILWVLWLSVVPRLLHEISYSWSKLTFRRCSRRQNLEFENTVELFPPSELLTSFLLTEYHPTRNQAKATRAPNAVWSLLRTAEVVDKQIVNSMVYFLILFSAREVNLDKEFLYLFKLHQRGG